MSMHSAVAHVLALDQGLHLEHETLEYMGYDDGTMTLLVIKGGVMFAYDLAPGTAPGSQEQLKWTYPLQEGPRVLTARVSLDGKILALQRSKVLLEFVDLATGNIFVHGSDKGRAEILSFFFTEQPDGEVVMATGAGLELCAFVAKRQGLRCKDRLRMPVTWARYTHETRMVLVGTGPPGAPYIQAFQFVSSGLVTLPPFAATAGAAATAVLSGAVPLAAGPGAVAAAAAPVVAVPADNVRLLKIYGRVYCAHLHIAARKLELYRFYTDTVVLQHSYELFSSSVDISVVDNVLLLHHPDAAVSVLIDVASDTLTPVANPLPLALLPPPGQQGGPGGMAGPGAAASTSSPGGASGSRPSSPSPSDGQFESSGSPSHPSLSMIRSSSSLLMSQWHFLSPNLVLDRTHQAVYRLALDLKAVVESCSDPAVLVGFLQRRRTPPGLGGDAVHPHPAAPKALLLGVIKNSLQERLPMPVLRHIFDDISQAYAFMRGRGRHTPAAGAGVAVPGGMVPCPQLLSPDEMSQGLFKWLHDEEVVDAPYLQAALSEYKSAAVAAGVQLPAYLQQLTVEMLLQQAQDHQVVQYVTSQAEHISHEVVLHLEGRSGPTPTLAPLHGGTAASASAAAASSAAAGAGAGAGVDAWPATGSGSAALALAGAPCSGGQLALDVRARRATQSALLLQQLQVQQQVAAASAAAVGTPPPPPVPPPQGPLPAGTESLGEYVTVLLSQGHILRASKLVAHYSLPAPTAKELLTAAGATGNLATFAAVYRLFREKLLPSFPKLDLARSKLLLSPGGSCAPMHSHTSSDGGVAA